MFTQDADIINITLYYKKNKHGYIVLSRGEFSGINEDEKIKYSELNIKMKNLTWEFYNVLQDINDEEGFKKYKEKKLKKLIVSWDATVNNDGITTKIPVSDDNIMRLHPEIAENILRIYDSEVFVDEAGEKKIAGNVYSYVMGKGKSTSGITRSIIENDLIEEFHWLPQDIAKIPYRKLQEFFIIRREKNHARNAAKAVAQFKAEASASSKRGSRRR